MGHLRHPDTALRLLNSTSTQRHICRSCLAHATRQFHTTRPSSAVQQGFFQRMRDTLFGSEKSIEATKQREEKQSKKLKAAAAKKEYGVNLRTVKDIKGQTFQIADVVDPDSTPDYRPALTWNGLDSVGSKAWVQARNDRGEIYNGFYPTKTLQPTENQWNTILHHVMVEILALKSAGRDISDIRFSQINKKSLRITLNTRITLDGQGEGATLVFKGKNTEQELLSGIPTEDKDVEPLGLIKQALGNKQFEKTVQDPSTWMRTSLQDPEVKIALTKRITQLTGRRIPDHVVSNAQTVVQLRNALTAKLKLKKLAQHSSLEEVRRNLPNVAVYSHRRTPIHKEKEVGRWKVIEEELIARDLPVTGTRWVGAKVPVPRYER